MDELTEPDGAPLSWRAWLLLPLVLIGLIGVVAPLTQVHGRDPEPAPFKGTPSEPRVPYNDELLPLLDDPDIQGREWRVIRGLHDRCVRGRKAGKIKQSLADRVRRMLDKHR